MSEAIAVDYEYLTEEAALLRPSLELVEQTTTDELMSASDLDSHVASAECQKMLSWSPVATIVEQVVEKPHTEQHFSPITGLPVQGPITAGMPAIVPKVVAPLPVANQLPRREIVPESASSKDFKSLIRESGLCAQADPEAFHPEVGTSTKAAKQVCLRCDVRDKCLQWALDTDQRYGIWGGTSERERRQLRKQRKSVAQSE